MSSTPIPITNNGTSNSSQKTLITQVIIVILVIILLWKLSSTTTWYMNISNPSSQQQFTPSSSSADGQSCQSSSTSIIKGIDLTSSIFKISSAKTTIQEDTAEESFFDFASDLVLNHLGPFSSASKKDGEDSAADVIPFDLNLVVTLAKLQYEKFKAGDTSPLSSLLPCKNEASMNWNIGLRTTLPSAPPSCLANWKEGTSTIKFYISMALSKLAHDEELHRMYNGLRSAVIEAEKRNEEAVGKSAQNALNEFRFATAKVISAHVHHAISAIQTLFEGTHPKDVSSSSLVSEFMKASITVPSSAGDSTKRNSAAAKSSFSSSSSYTSVARWLNNRITITASTISQNSVDYHRQPPIEGKFWNILRNEIGCSSLERSCENPEGCRYICNREYLLRGGNNNNAQKTSSGAKSRVNPSCSRRTSSNAKSDDTIAVLNAVILGTSSSSSASSPSSSNSNNNNGDAACIQLVSYGSNNEFDWEDSMVDIIRTSQAPFSGVATFDCTLHGGVRPSTSMQTLIKEDTSMFTFFSFCIGVAEKSLDVLSMMMKSNKNKQSTTPWSKLEKEGKTVSLVELDSQLKGIGERTTDDEASSASTSSRVSILKMDIESFEFVAAPRWLQVELAMIGKQLLSSKKKQQQDSNDKNINNNIDFTSLENMIYVEQLQTEIHRRGHKNKKAAGFNGGMWLQWLLLNYHALGFLTVANEKNHVDNCCFEAVFVHYRYYIASQSWYAARTV